MRLANKKENGHLAVLLVTIVANAQSADHAFATKHEQRFKRILGRLLGSVLCADGLELV